MTQTMTRPSIETRTLKIRYETLTDMLVSNLYALGVLSDNEDVTTVDLELPVDEDGMIEFDVEIVRS